MEPCRGRRREKRRSEKAFEPALVHSYGAPKGTHLCLCVFEEWVCILVLVLFFRGTFLYSLCVFEEHFCILVLYVFFQKRTASSLKTYCVFVNTNCVLSRHYARIPKWIGLARRLWSAGRPALLMVSSPHGWSRLLFLTDQIRWLTDRAAGQTFIQPSTDELSPTGYECFLLFHLHVAAEAAPGFIS